MSSYNGRRAPNVSHYLANLNTVPSTTHDVSGDLAIADADLDFLTNAEFFDFDSFQPNAVDVHAPPPRGPKGHMNGAHQFQFGEFQAFPNQPGNLHGHYPPQPAHQIPYGSPQTGDKRKSSVSAGIPSPQDLEDQSRMAAEEDKRRRNTAASARFRVKKKQREQALEKQAKEMTEKVQQLEGKVQQLEMENKWLKGLITDKNDGKTLDSIQKEVAVDDRKSSDPRRGVGTFEEVVNEDEDDEEFDVDALEV